MEAYDLWEAHDREQYKWEQSRPVCDVCGEHIQDEYLFEIDGNYVCEECLVDYMKEHYQKATEDCVTEGYF